MAKPVLTVVCLSQLKPANAGLTWEVAVITVAFPVWTQILHHLQEREALLQMVRV
ncbi:MAG TPA: hypothetical protein V6C78_10145 [Crinalium sp.]|jgi:hypothetical protein